MLIPDGQTLNVETVFLRSPSLSLTTKLMEVNNTDCEQHKVNNTVNNTDWEHPVSVDLETSL